MTRPAGDERKKEEERVESKEEWNDCNWGRDSVSWREWLVTREVGERR